MISCSQRRGDGKPCEVEARWRITDAADIWPLQYACDVHVMAASRMRIEPVVREFQRARAR